MKTMAVGIGLQVNTTRHWANVDIEHHNEGVCEGRIWWAAKKGV